MPISEHPKIGTIVICNFDAGFKAPEMVKVRPAIVVSPRMSIRAGLCTVVALSTTPPLPRMGYHCRLEIDPPLPPPWNEGENWVKGDMIYAVGLHRLDFIRTGKDREGKRLYRYETITQEQLKQIRQCILSSLGLAALTRHL